MTPDTAVPDPALRPHQDLLDLTGRSFIVTGGGAGIGRATAHRLSAAGASLVLADLDPAAAERVVADLPGPAQTLAVDVQAADAAPTVVDACVDAFGGVDGLINNAGIYPLEPVLSATAAVLDRTYAINQRATVLFAQAAARRMVDQGRGGRIVNVASIEAYHPAAVGYAGYAATKGAVVTFTRHLALELAPHGITVNAVAPGPVRTPGVSALGSDTIGADRGSELVDRFVARIPLGRLAEPDDIARTILFLTSPAADYITGETILVDGGNILS